MTSPVWAAIWFTAGAAVGTAQAGLLARAVRHSASMLGFFVRMMLAAAVLVLAAVWGHLLAGAGGWALGFAVAATRAYRRFG